MVGAIQNQDFVITILLSAYMYAYMFPGGDVHRRAYCSPFGRCHFMLFFESCNEIILDHLTWLRNSLVFAGERLIVQ